MEIVEALAAIGPRDACGDGERRAAVVLRDALRRRGRPARIEAAWVRPGWPWLYAGLCLLGAAGSLLAPSQPQAACAVLVVALAALAGDAGGWAPFARVLLPRRATQCVVSEPPPRPGRPRVRLIVTAAIDAGRGGLPYRLAPLETAVRRHLRGHLPSPVGLLCAALLVLAALAAARAAGLEGQWPNVVAIVPTVALLLGAAAFADIALAGPTPGANAHASAAAAALALVDALDRDPPRRLAVELVLAGAAEAGHLGWRDYVRRRRRVARPQELAVLALGPCGAGGPRHHAADGILPARRPHPTLDALARAQAPAAGAAPARHQRCAAAIARRAGWPAIGLSAVDARDLHGATNTAADTLAGIERTSIADVVAFALRLVKSLDRQL